MPFFEITVDLVGALRVSALALMERGGIIEEMESLGHRDLPFKRLSKINKDPVYSANYFIFRTHLPLNEVESAYKALTNNLDLVHVYFVNCKDLHQSPIKCNLDELLKPPHERKAVVELRQNQKIGHLNRQIIWRRTQRAWRAVPKSYPIATPRD